MGETKPFEASRVAKTLLRAALGNGDAIQRGDGTIVWQQEVPVASLSHDLGAMLGQRMMHQDPSVVPITHVIKPTS